MTWASWRAFLTMLTVLVTSITGGCSYFIAHSGVSGRGELFRVNTRAEVNDQFGKPDDTRTCPDGRIVESRRIRQALEPPDTRSGMEKAGAVLAIAAYSWWVVDMLFIMPVTLYRSEKAKLHYAFGYDEADRLLYLYDLAASPPVQFEEATRFLDGLLYSQLEARNCDTWTTCVTGYVQEVRRRATCLGYTLSADQEQTFERMFTIGEGVDSGRIPREEGQAEIREVLYARPTQ